MKLQIVYKENWINLEITDLRRTTIGALQGRRYRGGISAIQFSRFKKNL